MTGATKSISTPDADPGQAFTVKRIGRHLGAEIHGLDLSIPPDAATFERFEAALIEHKVVYVRDQHLDTAQHVRVGEALGELEVNPFADNDPNEGRILSLDTQRDWAPWAPIVSDKWHSDLTFQECPPRYSILRCEIMPEHGGDTLFADMTAAYDGLSDTFKKVIDGLEALHDFTPFRDLFSNSDEDALRLAQKERELPPMVHSVVRVHPVSGLKAIYVNQGFTKSIVGMRPDESRAILDLLFLQPHFPEYHFRLSWQPGTIAFWDNRSVQHYAIADYYPAHRRMRRVAVVGEQTLPRPQSFASFGRTKAE